MTDAPPPDPFAQPPQVAAPPAAPTAAPAPAKKPPWALIIGAIAVVAAVVVGVVLFTGGDDEKSSGSPAAGGGEWHLVRFTGDEVNAFEVLDANGAVVTSVPLEGDGVPALARQTGRWVVSESENAAVEVFDLQQGTSASVTLPASGLRADRGLLAAGTGYVAYSSGAGGPLALVDLAAATSSTIGSSEAGYYPNAPRPGYSVYLAIDFTNTIVIPHDDPSAWWEVPGPVSAISGRETIVLGMVDDEPAVRHFDGDQQVGKTVAMKAPQYAALFTSTGATTVDTGGGIWSIDFSTGDHEPLGTLGIGVDGALPISADLMMTWNSAGSRVIAADGTVTREIEPVEDADGELQPFIPVAGGVGSKCLTVQPGQRPRPEKAKAFTFDLATLEQVAQFEGTPIGFSEDGCSAVSLANPQELMLDGVIVEAEVDQVQAFSPDHKQIVAVMRGDEPAYVLVDLASGAQTELAAGAYFWARF